MYIKKQIPPLFSPSLSASRFPLSLIEQARDECGPGYEHGRPMLTETGKAGRRVVPCSPPMTKASAEGALLKGPAGSRHRNPLLALPLQVKRPASPRPLHVPPHLQYAAMLMRPRLRPRFRCHVLPAPYRPSQGPCTASDLCSVGTERRASGALQVTWHVVGSCPSMNQPSCSSIREGRGSKKLQE